MGYGPGPRLAVLGGAAELGGGTLLLVGLLTPFGWAAIIGVMVAATLAVHISRGLWNSGGGYELPLTFSAAAATLAFTGPGAWSLDVLIGLDLSGILWGAAAVALGGLAGVVIDSWRRQRLADAGEEVRERHGGT